MAELNAGQIVLIPRPRRPLIDRRRVRWTLQLTSVLIMVALWQWLGSRPDMFALAPPSKVFPELWRMIQSGEIVTAAANTLLSTLIGFLLAVIIGLGVGALIGLSSWGANTLEPIVTALYAAPVAMFIPLIGVYIGFDLRGRVFVIFLWSVFAIIVNTITGILETPAPLLEMAHSFGVGDWTIARKIVFPSALPQIVVGLRMAVGRAWRGALAAEVLLAVTNMGRLINDAASTFNMARMLAGIVLVIILGIGLMKLAEFAEVRILRWWLHTR
jgi:ABC-type nitrate/sulfonate/bicarbonate transport system permease component